MTRLEKCEILKEKGYTYDPETGKIYGTKGKEIIRKCRYGYIVIGSNYFNGSLKGHHLAWYMTYGNVDFIELDHINEEKKGIEGRSDNRICNLRISNRNQQNQNRSGVKGSSWHQASGKWRARIKVNKKEICLGYFNTEQEARDAYLEAKKKYHIID